MHQSEQLEDYAIFYIKEGKGDYTIDFEHYSFDGYVLFFSSPGQVFSVDTEKIKEAYKISFARDFYCIQTHGKEVSCDGVLFNNLYETPFVHPNEAERSRLDKIILDLTEDSRLAKSADSSQAAALHFAQVITRKRGQVNNDDIQLVKEAEFSDQDLIEIVLNVVSNTLTNYVNHLAQTEMDFPKVASGQFKQVV